METEIIERHAQCLWCGQESGSEKGVFWKRGLFKKSISIEMLENSDIWEILDSSLSVEKQGESDYFLWRL